MAHRLQQGDGMTSCDRIEPQQTTLAGTVRLTGIGLHSGRPVAMELRPAAADTGVRFERSDLPGGPELVARPASIHSARLCTVLGRNGTRVATVEHLLGALYALGVDNLRVVIDAGELPILDGSAEPFAEAVRRTGQQRLAARRTFLRVKHAVAVRDGDRFIRVGPARRLSIDCSVDFDHPLVSAQRHRCRVSAAAFERDIAPARTFGFLADVERLQRAGLALGGSLDNAVVIDRFAVLNPGGLRFPDECVRHKLLDILGDLALLGHPLLGRVSAHKSGHDLHHRLIRTLAAQADCLEAVQLEPEALPDESPAVAEPGLQSA